MAKKSSVPGSIAGERGPGGMFWNGLSLAWVASIRVVDVERSDDEVWRILLPPDGPNPGIYVTLARSDEEFRALIAKAVAYRQKREREAEERAARPPLRPAKVRVRKGEHLLDAPCMACGSYGCEGGCVR